MLTRRFWFFPVVLLAALVTFASPVLGAPRAQEGENLLENGDFEEEFSGPEGLQAGTGWEVWYLDAPSGPSNCHDNKPTFEGSIDIPVRNHSGNQATQIGARDKSYTAGIYQVVEGVESGQNYKLTVWGHVLYATSGNAQESYGPDPRMKVGIDPTGGINPFADTVVWGKVDWEFDSHWEFTVVAMAEDSTVTVFTYATQPECLASNFTFWDDASLVATSEPLSNWGDQDDTFRNIPSDALVKTATTEFKVGEAVSAPVDEPADDAADEGEEATDASEPASMTGTGTLCLLLFMDDNGNGSREVQEAKLADGLFTLTDGSRVVSTYTTDGNSEPYCFSSLPPGNYTLTWQAEGYEATSPRGWVVWLEANETLSNEFGAAASQEDDEKGSGSSRLLSALAIGGGVMVGLLALGAAAFFVLSRRGGSDEPPTPSADDTLIHRG